MKEELPLLTILEAPAGYGKSRYLRQFDKISVFYHYWLEKEGFKKRFIREIKNKFSETKNLDDIYSISEFLVSAREKIILIFDQWPEQSESEAVKLIDYLLEKRPEKLSVLISGRKIKHSLEMIKLISENKVKLIDKDTLKLSKNDFENLLFENNLNISEKSLGFFNKSEGWPLACQLYIRCQKGIISNDEFQELLNTATEEYLLNETDNLPEICQELYKKAHFDKTDYWVREAVSKKSLLLWQRAFQIADSRKEYDKAFHCLTNQLVIYGRESDYKSFEEILSKSEIIYQYASKEDKIVFLYQKANRLRQKCLHSQAFEAIDNLLNLNSHEKNSLQIQTKARVLKGLTAFQQGNYKETRDLYNQALLLAESEDNPVLKLEIKIMMAFLDVWEGKKTIDLGKDIISKIEEQPLKAQPLMLLNLAFYYSLGEDMDLAQTELILKKVNGAASVLGRKSLIPLIYDIEARIRRYNREYEKAYPLHEKAINLLEEDTFEYIHAYLNYGLSLLRDRKTEKANEILNIVREKAEKAGAKGLIKQVKTLLADNLSETVEITETKQNNNQSKTHEIEISLFGSFQVNINKKKILKWSRKKSRHILIHLLLHPRGIHRESLAEIIFSSDEIDNTLKNLDVNIHSLRKALEPDKKTKESAYILFQDSCYSFNRDCDYYSDLEEFNQNFRKWKESVVNNDFIRARDSATKITELYNGYFLPEIDFADNWEQERQYYHIQAEEIFLWLSNYLINQESLAEAEKYLEKFLEIDNLNENIYLSMLDLAKGKIILNSLIRFTIRL